jgi:hypothetical protein
MDSARCPATSEWIKKTRQVCTVEFGDFGGGLGGNWGWTPGLSPAMQALYCLSHATSPVLQWLF